MFGNAKIPQFANLNMPQLPPQPNIGGAGIALNKRQSNYLLAAYNLAPNERDTFYAEEIGKQLKMTPSETLDVFRVLANSQPRLMVVAPQTVRLSEMKNAPKRERDPRGIPANITLTGREIARQLRDDKIAAKKEKRQRLILSLGQGLWGNVLKIAVGVTIGIASYATLSHWKASATQPTVAAPPMSQPIQAQPPTKP